MKLVINYYNVYKLEYSMKIRFKKHSPDLERLRMYSGF